MIAFDEPTINYRITGPQSIERLDPLLKTLFPAKNIESESENMHESDSTVHFVWETTCEKTLRNCHKRALITNKLNNAQVIESKSSFAYLQLKMSVPCLTTYTANSSLEVSMWANKHWPMNGTLDDQKDWWAVKASNGNGGKDIWIVNRSNFTKVVGQLPAEDKYVIQR